MKTAITKILLLIMILSVSVFFMGCNKKDKTENQTNNSISSVSDQSNQDKETNFEADTSAPDIENSSSDLDNSEIATIEKYYSFLSNNNLEEAYQMRSNQKETSYDKFKDWYANAQYLKPYDFNKTDSGSYQFYVEYKDRNSVATKFKVEMLVIEDKIKTISSVEVVEKEEGNEENVSDWLTYTNEEFKYKISYPKTYTVTEYENDLRNISLNFKDTGNINYHANDVFVRVGDSANTADNFLAGIKEECDEGSICADISEDKIVDLSNVKGVRKITYSRAIGGYATSYFFTGKDGEKLNFELSLNFEEDEIRGKIIDSFEFF